jgi:Glycosyl transferases group 1
VKVYVYPADLGGCGYYRLIWPAKILQAAGHDVVLVHPKSAHRSLRGGTNAAGQLVQLNVPADADVMVFQRVTSMKMVEAFTLMRAGGKAVVIDVDDDLDAIDQRNPGWEALHPRTGGKMAEYNWHATHDACERATLVTVSTDALLERYATPRRQGEPYRGVVLRNAVPQFLLNEDRYPRVDSAAVGWPGALATHPDDPTVTGSALGRLQREGVEVRIVGDPGGCRRAFQLDAEPTATGPTTVQEWPTQVNRLGIGVAPLVDTAFNRAKSWLKPLECAALGVPVVMSPRDEYLRIHDLGVGLIANSPREWYRQLRRLVDDPALRAELSVSGRAVVRDAGLVIEQRAQDWWQAWTQAYQMERSPLGVPRRPGPRVEISPAT